MTRSRLLLPLLLSSSCLTLDGFVFGGIHCSDVGPDTCNANDPVWDQVCLTCEQPYDWQKRYEWLPGTLDFGETIRPVAPESLAVVKVPLDGGEADAVFIEGFGDNGDITILYNHGNYASLEHYQPRIRMLHEAGYSVFAWDYRGYGKSQPDTYPSPQEFMDDAAVIRKAVAELAPDPDRIVVYGYSLGAIPSVEMATTNPGCALVLETPFPSLRNFAEASAAVSLPDQLVSDGQFDNVRKIRQHDGPLLAMAGERDGLIPPPLVEELANANGGPTAYWLVEGSEHGIATRGVPEQGLRQYLDRLAEFLATTPCSSGS